MRTTRKDARTRLVEATRLDGSHGCKRVNPEYAADWAINHSDVEANMVNVPDGGGDGLNN